MSTETKALEYGSAAPSSSSAPSASTALARPSEAERRVALAKERLQHHLAVLDQRARAFAKQSAWIAGMVLLGFVGVAAASSMFRSKPRRAPRPYYASGSRGEGRSIGPALMLAAFGLLGRGARSIAAHRMRSL
jgi:hypothetical protein